MGYASAGLSYLVRPVPRNERQRSPQDLERLDPVQQLLGRDDVDQDGGPQLHKQSLQHLSDFCTTSGACLTERNCKPYQKSGSCNCSVKDVSTDQEAVQLSRVP
jgi:hypothetical protein